MKAITFKIKRLKRFTVWLMVFIMIISVFQLMNGGQTVLADSSGDAYVNYDQATKTWTIGTAKVEKKVQLNVNGQFMLTQFKNKITDREYIQGIQNSDEFSVNVNGVEYTGMTTGWIYDTHSITIRGDSSIILNINFHNSILSVTRNYEVYPNTGIIKEWSTFKNISGSSANFSSPYIFKQRVMQNEINDVDFYYMRGGGNFTGSWMLKQTAMSTGYARFFDSYDSPEKETVDGVYGGAVGSRYNGASIYDQFYILRNKSHNDGVWVVFDYNGHWYGQAGDYGKQINLSAYVSMTDYAVSNNNSITGPKATIGVFSGDLDDMGNSILNYIYTYQWDYYNEDYAGGGTWQWTVSPQAEKAFQSVNYNRYIGGNIIHIDGLWHDKKGDWNEEVGTDDLAAIVTFAGKSNAKLRLWMPPYHADYGSLIVENNPDYVCAGMPMTFYGLTLNLANPSVKSWMSNMLNAKQQQFGAYQVRLDGIAAYTVNGSDNDMLKQSENFFSLLKEFRDNNPNASIQGCASGGETALMETIRYVDNQQITDGNVLHYGAYYLSLRAPIDKLQHGFNAGPGGDDTSFCTLDEKDKSVWEMSRMSVERGRYLKSQGLVGRYVWVYRPEIDGEKDKTYFLQKMNSDNTKGCILTANYFPYYDQSFTIYPKGLTPGSNYTVRSTDGSVTTATNTGSYWMTNGISVANFKSGELISFNLPDVPGMGSDTQMPAAPSNVTKKTATYCGKFGIELNWTAGTDNVLLSYYEIYKNGISVDKVSKGTFSFITEGDFNDIWEVRSVDGDGNTSSKVTASQGDMPSPSPTPTPAPPSSYKASTDFGSEQGYRNWEYQQNDTRVSGKFYFTNMDYDQVNSYWTGEQGTRIEEDMMQPSTNYNVVRKWYYPQDCTVRITGTAKMAQTGGDGVKVSLRRGKTDLVLQYDELWFTTISGSDTTGQTHDVEVSLKAYQPIYFVVNKNATTTNDMTIWDPQITVLTPTPTPTPTPLWDASADFGSTQGQEQWYYRQKNGSTYSNMTWDSVNGYWVGDQTYCIVASSWQHPNTNDSVREWVAPQNGRITISGNAKKGNTGGDGVEVRIKKNDITIWGPNIIQPNDTTGINHLLGENVYTGDSIRFEVNKIGTSYFDTTSWDPSISLATPTPTPTPVPTPTPTPTPGTWTASSDFSSTQGQNNWYYLQKSGTTYSNMSWDSINGYWVGAQTYCIIARSWQHPNTNDSVRKWVAPVQGTIKITGNPRKSDTSGGDGVIVQIKKNGTTIWGPKTIAYNDGYGINHEAVVRVNAGDIIYFEMNKISTSYNDATTWDPTIEYLP